MVVNALGDDSLPSKSHMCDRRRSRAARELLRIHLIRAWQETDRVVSSSSANQQHHHHPTIYNVDVTEWNIWQLLDATVVLTSNNDGQSQHTCPLLPQYDIHREHEESYSILDVTSKMIPKHVRNSAIPGILHHNRTLRKAAGKSTPLRQLYPLIYHCDICQKNFTSQYYLDQHLISKHPVIHQNTSNTSTLLPVDMICPADTYCSLLSPIVCHYFMIQEEPHYGPGHYRDDHHSQFTTTSSSSSNSNSVPCNDFEQQKAIQKCHEIVALCFHNDDDDDNDESIRKGRSNMFEQILSANMCSTIPNCPTRLVHQMWHSITDPIPGRHVVPPSRSLMDWIPAIWLDHHHTATTWTALLLVTGMFVLIFGHFVYQIYLAIQQRQQQQRPRSPQQQQQHRRSLEPIMNVPPPIVSHHHRQSRTVERMNDVSPPTTTYIVPTSTTTTKTKLT